MALLPKHSVFASDLQCLARFCSLRLALVAGTDLPQKVPRVNSEVVTVVPVELDGVLADTFGGEWSGGGLEHRQCTRRGFRRFPRGASGLAALLFAERTWAGIPQKNKGIGRVVAVAPVDFHSRPTG